MRVYPVASVALLAALALLALSLTATLSNAFPAITKLYPGVQVLELRAVPYQGGIVVMEVYGSVVAKNYTVSLVYFNGSGEQVFFNQAFAHPVFPTVFVFNGSLYLAVPNSSTTTVYEFKGLKLSNVAVYPGRIHHTPHFLVNVWYNDATREYEVRVMSERALTLNFTYAPGLIEEVDGTLIIEVGNPGTQCSMDVSAELVSVSKNGEVVWNKTFVVHAGQNVTAQGVSLSEPVYPIIWYTEANAQAGQPLIPSSDPVKPTMGYAPSGYAPFGVKGIDGDLYLVTFVYGCERGNVTSGAVSGPVINGELGVYVLEVNASNGELMKEYSLPGNVTYVVPFAGHIAYAESNGTYGVLFYLNGSEVASLRFSYLTPFANGTLLAFNGNGSAYNVTWVTPKGIKAFTFRTAYFPTASSDGVLLVEYGNETVAYVFNSSGVQGELSYEFRPSFSDGYHMEGWRATASGGYLVFAKATNPLQLVFVPLSEVRGNMALTGQGVVEPASQAQTVSVAQVIEGDLGSRPSVVAVSLGLAIAVGVASASLVVARMK
ncbi:MAG: hypothetical protein ACP5HQ_08395 [Thermoprotei archaeon]